MYPDYRPFAVIALCVVLLVSSVSGMFASFVLRLRIRGASIVIDALLGAGGSLAATTLLWQGGFRDDTRLAYVEFGVATVLPILRESYRFKRARPR
jgi:hypothetical protein